ncbi:MAG: endonuclease/exonuclease/phosphatase family protein [Phenylobacterium sp.]
MRVLRFAFDLVVLGLALLCGVAAVAAQGGRWNPRLDLLTHPTPLWLLGGAVALLLCLTVSSTAVRIAAVLFGLAAVISSTVLMWPDLARVAHPQGGSASGQTIKLVEVNAWGRNRDVERVVRLIQDEDPDVVIVLEGSPLVAQELQEATRLHVFSGSGAIIATRETPLRHFAAWDARDLPGGPTEFSWVVLPGGGAPFSVVGVHRLWPIPSRVAEGQDMKLASLTGALDRSSLILAGDFNSTQWSFRQKRADHDFRLERRDLATPTWPARIPQFGGLPFPFPFLSIDHVYAGPEWRTVSVRRGPRVGSDHYPLIAVFSRDAPRR